MVLNFGGNDMLMMRRKTNELLLGGAQEKLLIERNVSIFMLLILIETYLEPTITVITIFS
jgi:hypothetical protein